MNLRGNNQGKFWKLQMGFEPLSRIIQITRILSLAN